MHFCNELQMKLLSFVLTCDTQPYDTVAYRQNYIYHNYYQSTLLHYTVVIAHAQARRFLPLDRVVKDRLLYSKVAPKHIMATPEEVVQSSLEKALSELGYSGKVAKLPSSLAGNEKITKFLEWLLGNLTPDNHLTTSELEKLVFNAN